MQSVLFFCLVTTPCFKKCR